MKRFLCLIFFCLSAHADVYKCKLATGAIEYQAEPCPSAVKQIVVPIKPQDPIESAKAEARFAAWQAEQERLENIRMQEQKERQVELDRQATVEAMRRAAIAQERQAAAAAQPPPVIVREIVSDSVARWRDLHQPMQFEPAVQDRLFNPIIDTDPRFAPYH